MVEFNASFRSVETSVTQINASIERNALAVRANGARDNSDNLSLLNNQQQQIIDEVGISEAAIQQFEDAQILAEQLQGYLDYLNGGSRNVEVQLTANDNEPNVEIAGRSTRLAADITVATYNEETLEISGTIDDAGNLTELSIERTSISAEFVQANLILEDRQFFASA